jgi:hypothetical protein
MSVIMARLLHQWEQTPSRPAACMRARVFANAGAATLKAHKPFFCAARRYDPLTAASTNQTPARYNCLFPSGCANRDAEGMHFCAVYTPCAVPATALSSRFIIVVIQRAFILYININAGRRGKMQRRQKQRDLLEGHQRLYIPRANWSRRRRSI